MLIRAVIGGRRVIRVNDNFKTKDKFARVFVTRTGIEVMANITYDKNSTTFRFPSAPKKGFYTVNIQTLE